MADRALAEPASAHPELADDGCRATATTATTPTDSCPPPRWPTSIASYADVVDAPVQTHTTVASVQRRERRVRRRHRPGHVDGADRRARQRRLQLSDRAGARAERCRRRSHSSRRWTTVAPTSWPTAACSSSAPAPPACSSPTRSTARAGRSRSPSASTCACRARYRGRDIFWWMEAAGVLDERYDEVDDITRARHVPSPQLSALAEHRRARPQRARARSACAIVGRLGAHRRRAGAVRRLARQRRARWPTSR